MADTQHSAARYHQNRCGIVGTASSWGRESSDRRAGHLCGGGHGDRPVRPDVQREQDAATCRDDAHAATTPEAIRPNSGRVSDRCHRHRSELRRACGCVYKYRVEPKYIGLHPLPDKEFKVIYQVTGGHQPQTGDFTVHGDQARVLQDVPLEGPPGARLQASVTQVVG